MKRQALSRRSLFLVAWLSCLAPAILSPATAFAQAQVTTRLNKKVIYEGDFVLLTIELENLPDDVQPLLEGYEDFDVSKPQRSTSESIFESGAIRRVRRTVKYNYRIQPRKTGTLTLPAAKIVVGNKTYRGKSLQLEVKRAQDQDLVRLEMSVSKKEVFLTQAFTVTLRIYVKALPNPFQKEDPIAVLRDPPQLTINWALDDKLPKGMTPTTPWQTWLSDYNARRNRGFAINRVGMQFAFTERLTRFRLPSKIVQRADKNQRMVNYWEYVIERDFVGSEPGVLKIEPARMSGGLPNSVNGRNQLMLERIGILSKALTVRVLESPAQDQPAHYVGVMGKMQVTANLAPQKAKVGDPMTLTITLSGEGTLRRASPPALSKVESIRDNFKIYDPTSRSENGRRIFTYVVRPKSTELQEFPKIPIAFFDTAKEEYVTVETAALPMSIADVSGEGVEATMAKTRRDREQNKYGIFANVTEFETLRNQSFTPMRWVYGMVAMLGAFFVAAFATHRIRLHNADHIGRRKRTALSTALNFLEDSGDRQDQSLGETVGQAITTAVAHVAEEDAQGMTTSEAVQQLEAWNCTKELLERIGALLDECDAARYGGSELNSSKLTARARSLIEDLFVQLRERKLC